MIAVVLEALLIGMLTGIIPVSVYAEIRYRNRKKGVRFPNLKGMIIWLSATGFHTYFIYQGHESALTDLVMVMLISIVPVAVFLETCHRHEDVIVGASVAIVALPGVVNRLGEAGIGFVFFSPFVMAGGMLTGYVVSFLFRKYRSINAVSSA